jgi:hypothetical protein
MASGSAVAVSSFDALPEPVWRVIMLALPVDARARAACVCRAWRAFMADPALWNVLDLTAAGGVAAERMTENLVRGAVARAAGQLREFSLNWVPNLNVRELLVALVVSDGAALQLVSSNAWMTVADVAALLAAAPGLRVLNAERVKSSCTELLPVMRNDPPYGPLRVSKLEVTFGQVDTAADVLALAAAVPAHGSLKALNLVTVNSSRGLNALVDAAAERRVSRFKMLGCVSDAETLPALARLMQRSSLTKLEIHCDFFPNEQDVVPVLCAALRSCRMLTVLQLLLVPPGGARRRDVTELLDAIASLSALSLLSLTGSRVHDAAAFGRALGALLRVNQPSLRLLHVNFCGLGDEGLAPLLDGLATNTHLRKLNCEINLMSEAFRRDRLAPALAALAARAERDA